MLETRNFPALYLAWCSSFHPPDTLGRVANSIRSVYLNRIPSPGGNHERGLFISLFSDNIIGTERQGERRRHSTVVAFTKYLRYDPYQIGVIRCLVRNSILPLLYLKDYLRKCSLGEIEAVFVQKRVYVVNSKRGCRSPSLLRSAGESHPPNPVPSPCICNSRCTSLRFPALRALKYTSMPTEHTAIPSEKTRLIRVAF
jgi:hypothetical protein